MCTCILGYAHTHTKHSLEIISHNASAGVSVGEFHNAESVAREMLRNTETGTRRERQRKREIQRETTTGREKDRETVRNTKRKMERIKEMKT